MCEKNRTTIDYLGNVKLPFEILLQAGLHTSDILTVFYKNITIFITKVEESCFICGGIDKFCCKSALSIENEVIY